MASVNRLNPYTTDPTVFSNYVIDPCAVDPKRGKTPEEKKKYTIKRIVAIALYIFIGLATAGFGFAISLALQDIRAESYDNKAIETAKLKLGYSKNELNTHEFTMTLQEARFKAANADALNTSNEKRILKFAEIACWTLCSRWPNGEPSEELIKVVAEAFKQTRYVGTPA